MLGWNPIAAAGTIKNANLFYLSCLELKVFFQLKMQIYANYMKIRLFPVNRKETKALGSAQGLAPCWSRVCGISSMVPYAPEWAGLWDHLERSSGGLDGQSL